MKTSQSPQKYLSELHQEHNEFRSILNFSKDELMTFNHRLEEIAKANTIQDVLMQVEKFQNHFIRQSEVIDELMHEIGECERHIAQLAEENNVATDHRKADDHVELRDKMETFQKLYNELKRDYMTFLSKTF